MLTHTYTKRNVNTHTHIQKEMLTHTKRNVNTHIYKKKC